MKKSIIGIFLSVFLFIFGIVVLFGPLISDENYNYDSNQNIIGLNLSPEVLKYKPLVEKYANKYEIGEYVNCLLGIIQVESGGNLVDVMQSSESLGLPPNTLDTEPSIEQGCKYFSQLINISNKNRFKHSYELSEKFAGNMSGGIKVDYNNPIAISRNGGWRYKYGNQFYVEVVLQWMKQNLGI